MWIVLFVAGGLTAQELTLERVLEKSRLASPELGATGILLILEAGHVQEAEARKALLAEALEFAKQAPEPVAYSYRMGPTDAIGHVQGWAFRNGIDRISLLSRTAMLARAEGPEGWRSSLDAARTLVPEEKMPECFDPMVVDLQWLNRALPPDEVVREKFPFSLRMGLKFCRPHEMYWQDDVGADLYGRLDDPQLLPNLRRWQVRDAKEMSLWFHEKAALLSTLFLQKKVTLAWPDVAAHLTGEGAMLVKKRRRLDWFSEVIFLVERLARLGKMEEIEELRAHREPDIALVAMLWGSRVDGRVKPKLR